jgi:hypothetical protein
MILATSGIIASQIVSVDPDWLAYYNRVIAAGGSLTTTEQSATLQLVLDLKANSLWTPMKAIYPMVGASAAACAQNLKSSSFTGTFTSGWTFASTGATPNGTSAYMDTNLNASTVLGLNSTHYSYYSRTNIISNQVDMGANIPSSYLIFNYNNLALSAINATQTQRASAASPTTGFLIGSRSNSTEEKYYTNNVAQTLISASTAQPNLNIYIACYNNSGTALYFSSKQCAFTSIGDGLTDTQASNLYTAVQAFQTTLSRQV